MCELALLTLQPVSTGPPAATSASAASEGWAGQGSQSLQANQPVCCPHGAASLWNPLHCVLDPFCLKAWPPPLLLCTGLSIRINPTMCFICTTDLSSSFFVIHKPVTYFPPENWLSLCQEQIFLGWQQEQVPYWFCIMLFLIRISYAKWCFTILNLICSRYQVCQNLFHRKSFFTVCILYHSVIFSSAWLPGLQLLGSLGLFYSIGTILTHALTLSLECHQLFLLFFKQFPSF